MKRLLALLLLVITACASTPASRARTAGVIQKASVDGMGNAYLQYCEVVRVPKCVAADEKATADGSPMSKDDRIACLRPCDSKTATLIRDAVDVVRTAQTVLYEAIKSGASEEDLAASRQQLLRTTEQLIALLRATGVLELIEEVMEGR